MTNKDKMEYKYLENLRVLRKKKNIKQSDVAAYLGVNRSTYTKYENGVAEPSIDYLIKLAGLYNVSVDYLIGASRANDIDIVSIGNDKVEMGLLCALGAG